MDEAFEQAAKKIIAGTYTKADAYARLLLLQDVLEQQVYGGHADDADLAVRIRERYQNGSEKDKWHAGAVAEWGSEVVGAFAGTEVEGRIAEMKKRIENASQLVLYVPAAFGPEAVRMLGEWCRANIDPQVFLELHVDASVVGGCSFVWRDTLHDFSLAHRIEEHQAELSERIESYLASAA